ncbi:MAG: hypothetical protein RIQ78_314, partial [Bacteroidota bacterium]
VFHFGIHRINDFDAEFARRRGGSLKLVARCFRDQDKVAAYCIPKFIPSQHRYSAVRNEYNAVTLESAFSEQQLFVGKGAGDKPTGCAVLSDISALRYQYKYEYRKLSQNGSTFDTRNTIVTLYVRHEKTGQVPESDFLDISERFVSGQFRYWIGRIKLDQLQKATWLKEPGVSIVEI